MKELRDLFADKEALEKKRKDLKEKALAHRDAEEMRQVKTEIGEIDKQLESINNEIRSIQEENAKKNNNREVNTNMEENKHGTMEYRKAFMDYIQRGIKGEELEFRVDQSTTTTTAASVIPSTIVAEIIRQSKIRGNVLSKVRKMNIKGGMAVPTMSAVPTASWISETTQSSRQKLDTDKITFSYYGLECKIAQTLLSEYTSIDAFEREFVTLVVEAMTDAKEIAIFNGTGSTQPTGIFKAVGVTETQIKAVDFVKFDKLNKALGELDVAYRPGAELFMAAGTWDKIVGMVDSTGQPVARVNYGLNGIARSFMGYPVNLVGVDRIKDIDSASAGTDFIMVLGDMGKYAINSNGDLGVYRYRDEEKNQDVTKALEFLDGNVLDKHAFLRIKLATA